MKRRTKLWPHASRGRVLFPILILLALGMMLPIVLNDTPIVTYLLREPLGDSGLVVAQEDAIREGELALAAGDLRVANERFGQAVENDPTNPQANFFYAATRVMTQLIDNPQLLLLASQIGIDITGDASDVCALELTIPDEVLPGAPRTGAILTALRDVLLPEIIGALGNLEQIPEDIDLPFNLMNLPICVQPATNLMAVELDGTDIQALHTILQSAYATLEFLTVYNLDANLLAATTQISRDILAGEPTLLNLNPDVDLSAVRELVDQALTDAIMTLALALAETDDQSNDVLVIVGEDVAGAQRTMETLESIRQALEGPVVVNSERLDLSLLFSGSFGSLRPFTPVFDDSQCTAIDELGIITGTLTDTDPLSLFRGHVAKLGARLPLGRLPDPTFGGTALDFTQLDFSELLNSRNHFSNCYTFSGTVGQ